MNPVSTTRAEASHLSEEVERLRLSLAKAEAAASDAFRDTARLIRLLTAVGTPSPPEGLLARTLTVLSEVYSADVTCLAELVGDRLIVTASCGLPEDDPAGSGGWVIGPTARQALNRGQPLARSVSDSDEVPPSLRGIGVRFAAWIPVTLDPGAGGELLILFRRRPEPFKQGDLRILSSVGYRMTSAFEAAERAAAIDRLAKTGHELARHLDMPRLLEEAVSLLRTLTGGDRAWIVTLSNGMAHLGVYAGLPDESMPSWPRRIDALPAWGAARHGEPYRWQTTGPLGALPQTGLCAPVMAEGEAIALLCASGTRPRLLGKATTEVVTVLANHLAVAMRNGDLYRALARSERKLRQRATHDPLTGLANRVLARQSIEDALARQPRMGAVGLLFCDLDNFKSINDRLGHEVGDELIQKVARRLRECVRPDDVLARFGGDEFVLVVDGARSLGDIMEMGRRIQAALVQPFHLRGDRVQMTASIGGVLGMPGQATPSELLRDADAAMYAAKGKGPGRVEVFDAAASHRSLSRLDLLSDMPRALQNGELSLEFQPIHALASGRAVGLEALLRWNHPRQGSIPPDVFIPLAEETEAIVPIGEWVLEQACRQAVRWRRLPGREDLAIWVNVSPVQLAHPDLVKTALDTIAGAGLQPGDVWLEVTEHSSLTEECSEPFARLRDAGVHVALDDFGMSYSSLSYLRRFPVECLKIDRSFVSGLAESETDRGIVRAILAIAASLELDVIAEGIETDVHRDVLLELGCLRGQGYLLSRPLPPDAVTELLRATGPAEGGGGRRSPVRRRGAHSRLTPR